MKQIIHFKSKSKFTLNNVEEVSALRDIDFSNPTLIVTTHTPGKLKKLFINLNNVEYCRVEEE